ncbi:hypothetical protein Tco_1179036, partial [Tanacetum coccineum]
MKEIRKLSRIDDNVVQDQRQQDDYDLQDEKQDQPKEEEVEPRRSKRARTEISFGPELFLLWWKSQSIMIQDDIAKHMFLMIQYEITYVREKYRVASKGIMGAHVEPVYVQNRVSVNEISSLKEGKLEWRKMVKCQLRARL